jgi:hypothetical protein
MRYKIDNYSQFQKDSESKAILNVDKNALNAYKAQRKNIKKALDVNAEIENLKQDMVEIKSLLHQLINNK